MQRIICPPPVCRRAALICQGGDLAIEGDLARRAVAPDGADLARGGVVAEAEPGGGGLLRKVAGAGVQLDELGGLARALEGEACARGGARRNAHAQPVGVALIHTAPRPARCSASPRGRAARRR